MNKQIQISILVNNGKLVFHKDLANETGFEFEHLIDISSLSSGVYFISVNDGTEIFYEKLMVY